MVWLRNLWKLPYTFAVSPVSAAEYLLSKILSLGSIALIVAAVLALTVKVPHLPSLLLGTFLSGIMFTLFGIIIAAKIVSLNQFILWTVSIEILGFVPTILHIFHISPARLNFYPLIVCMDLITGNSFSGKPAGIMVRKNFHSISVLWIVRPVFSMISPVMFCFVAAMVILEERDDHICHYLFVTGSGRMGYLLSRICIPALCAFTVTLILLPFFKLTALSAGAIFFLAVTGTLQGIIIALLVVTLSTNKLEGMAVTKLSTLLILGALIPYFIQEKVQYILSILPSFWVGKAILEQNLRYMLLSVFMAAIWIFLLLKKFKVKIS